MATIPSFCLVRCNSRPMAVAVENVVQVLELDELVSIPLCPPQVAGLCAYHRQVLPVATLNRDGATAPSPSLQVRATGKATRETVLVMRSEQGLWCLKIDRGGTVVTEARPSRHEPIRNTDGVLTIGLVRHEGTDHALLDAAETWRGLRDVVVNGFLRVRESAAAESDGDPAIP